MGLACAALAVTARAQDADPARATVVRFLTEGSLAPCPDGDVAGVGTAEPLAQGERSFARPGELLVSVGATGEVTFFSRSRPLMYVEGRGARRAQEVLRRARFTLEQEVARARRFLADHHPEFGERRFELGSAERCDHDSLVEDELVFVERARPGVAACWPNRIDVSMNPEAGCVTTYVATHDRLESATPPALDAEAARRALVAVLGDRVRADNRAFLAHARAELVAAPGRDGRPCTAWLVAGIFVVDASSGELLSRRPK
jgi:hypothetical protein